jgi:exonuclease SbcD
MKVLHTADWHVGGTLHRHQRLEEAEAVLSEVVEIAQAEEVDLALVCGDVYEHFAPSAEAERIVYKTLLALSSAGIPVIVVAGNHDYARRLIAVQELLRAVNVYVAAEPRRPEEGGLIEITSRGNGEVAQVAVLPWVAERSLFGAEEMMGLQPEPFQAYAEQVPRLLGALCRPFDPKKISILAGHLFVSGSKLGGGERELTIGQIFAINAAALPTSPQYIALGHVHRPQDVPGAAIPARYAGSTLQMDFGEVDQTKSMTIVELSPGRPAQVREVPLTRGKRLVDVRVAHADLQGARGADDGAFARVFLECEGPQPGLVDDVRDVLPNAVEVRLEYERQDPERRAVDLRHLKPGELFERYYHERHGAEPSERLTKLFAELFEEVVNAPAAD